jgi:hypothetical protein
LFFPIDSLSHRTNIDESAPSFDAGNSPELEYEGEWSLVADVVVDPQSRDRFALSSLPEAVVLRKAKVRTDLAIDSPFVVSLAEGAIVCVVDTAVPPGGELRSRVEWTDKEGKEVAGWVSSRLLSPRRRVFSPRDAKEISHMAPRELHRELSLQRPKIHIAL